MVAIDGLNPTDPGVLLLSTVAARRRNSSTVLAYCGDIPGAPEDAVRLILDVRERVGSAHTCQAASLDPSCSPHALTLGSFATALCWPRPHLGKEFTLRTLAEAGLLLADGGELYCAARKKKGGKTLALAMRALMGQTETIARKHGYHLYRSIRTRAFDETLARTYATRFLRFADTALGEFELETTPGVFSHRGLDAGTRCLIEHLEHLEHVRAQAPTSEPSYCIDLCSGVGPLAIWWAKRWSANSVLAIETNVLAAAMIRRNADRLGIGKRLTVRNGDGLDRADPVCAPLLGSCEIALCNPPTHASPEELARLLGELRPFMARDAAAHIVVNRPGSATAALEQSGARLQVFPYPGYTVLTARWS
ncbi:MAG: methyltransferase [Nannocystaceae bacterium]